MVISRRQLELETVFLVAIAAAASLFFVVQKNSNYQPQYSVASGAPFLETSAEVISPEVTVTSHISPDGTRRVIMKETRVENMVTYDFLTAEESDQNGQPVFTKILTLSSTMSIPFNTWSPDNKYFFVQESSGDDKNFFVFEALGSQFAQGEEYLDVAGLFNQKNTGNNFDEVTGWASESLVIINTTKQDGSKGPSYWLEVPSKAIIQLSTEF